MSNKLIGEVLDIAQCDGHLRPSDQEHRGRTRPPGGAFTPPGPDWELWL